MRHDIRALRGQGLEELFHRGAAVHQEMLKRKLGGRSFVNLPVEGGPSEDHATQLLKRYVEDSKSQPALVALRGLPESGKTCVLLKLYSELCASQNSVYVVYVACTSHGVGKRVVYEALQSEYCLPVTQIQDLQKQCREGHVQLVILLDGPFASSVVSGVHDRWQGCCKAIVFAVESGSENQEASHVGHGLSKEVVKSVNLKPLEAKHARSFGLDPSQTPDDVQLLQTPAGLLRLLALSAGQGHARSGRDVLQAQHRLRLASQGFTADELDHLVEDQNSFNSQNFCLPAWLRLLALCASS